MYAILTQLKFDLQHDISFEWSFVNNRRYRYDFVLTKFQTIIEVDGLQHFENTTETSMFLDKDKQKLIDNLKDTIAYKNNYKIIRIDCRKSDFEYLKNNIENSDLKYIIDFSPIDWIECGRFALNSFMTKCINLWNANETIHSISSLLHINKATVVSYLKRGNKLSLCIYDPVEIMKNTHKKIGQICKVKLSKAVICVNTGELFSSITEAQRKYGGGIGDCCRGKRKTAGGYKWRYADEIIKEGDIQLAG
jgi:very-short-patch-repair endonuclease